MTAAGFSPEWDATYRQSKHLSVWPWSDLVSCIMRYARPDDGFRRVLELGCGAGANIPLFLSIKADYWAIDGSQAAVQTLHENYPALKERIFAGDFTSALPGEGIFDCIVDRAAVTHNSTAAIRRCLDIAFRRLRPGGKYIGIDWFSSAHQDSRRGDPVDDHTRTNIASRQFNGVGAVHFSDQSHLEGLLVEAGLRIEFMEHKEINSILPEPGRRASWNFVAIKPETAPLPS